MDTIVKQPVACRGPATNQLRPEQNITRRSAVTNGKRLHVVTPGDTAWSRRFRDILSQIIDDQGGADTMSEGQRQLARRAATISIACEHMEGEAAAGRPIDLDAYGQLTDRLGRTLQRLGLKRVRREALTLGQILQHGQGGPGP